MAEHVMEFNKPRKPVMDHGASFRLELVTKFPILLGRLSKAYLYS